jgi:hypothetical protein
MPFNLVWNVKKYNYTLLRTQKNMRIKVNLKGLSLIFKQEIKQDYMIQKQEHKN